MGQTYNTPNLAGGGDSVVNSLAILVERTDTLRSSFSGSSVPGSPVVGQTFAEDAGGVDTFQVYLDDGSGNGWEKIPYASRGTTDINGDPNTSGTRAAPYQLIGWRWENRTSAWTPAAGNIGGFYFRTDTKIPYIVLDSSTLGALLHAVEGTDFDSVDLDLSGQSGNGATPPTENRVGTTPAVRGLLFDSTSEKHTLTTVVPANFADTGDLYLDLYWALDSAGTSGDDIEVSCDWVAVTPGTDAANKTSTAASMATTDIGAVTAQYSIFKTRTTIDYDHADNPVDAGDILAMEISRTTIGGAGKAPAATLVGARLLYPRKAREAR